MVWVATSPTCATNFSFRLPASLHPPHGQRLRGDVLALEVEGPVHGDGDLEDLGDRARRGRACRPRGRGTRRRPRSRSSSKPRAASIIRSSMPRGVDLGVREAHPVRAHVFGVATDVGDQQERRARRSWLTIASTTPHLNGGSLTTGRRIVERLLRARSGRAGRRRRPRPPARSACSRGRRRGIGPSAARAAERRCGPRRSPSGGVRRSSAISPKPSPGPRVATTRPSPTTSASPDSIT